jgi:hypothetical protein
LSCLFLFSWNSFRCLFVASLPELIIVLNSLGFHPLHSHWLP